MNRIEEIQNEESFGETLRGACEDILKQSENPTLESGPQFWFETKHGDPVMVNTLKFHGKHPAGLGEVDFIYYFAFDSNGRIVGYKEQMIKELDSPSYGGSIGDFVSNGYLETGVRGKGIASAIENANKVMLSAYAKSKGKQVIWSISNDNKTDLNRLLEKREDGVVNEALEKQISKKEEEQNRWTRLYSRLGRNDRGRVILSPNSGGYNLEELKHSQVILNNDGTIQSIVVSLEDMKSQQLHTLSLHL